jgi:hypothetical protein
MHSKVWCSAHINHRVEVLYWTLRDINKVVHDFLVWNPFPYLT